MVLKSIRRQIQDFLGHLYFVICTFNKGAPENLEFSGCGSECYTHSLPHPFDSDGLSIHDKDQDFHHEDSDGP